MTLQYLIPDGTMHYFLQSSRLLLHFVYTKHQALISRISTILVRSNVFHASDSDNKLPCVFEGCTRSKFEFSEILKFIFIGLNPLKPKSETN